MVATTKLSHFVTGRYLPTDAWRTIWQTILARLSPDAPPLRLEWTPTVRPSYDSAVRSPPMPQRKRCVARPIGS